MFHQTTSVSHLARGQLMSQARQIQIRAQHTARGAVLELDNVLKIAAMLDITHFCLKSVIWTA